jgi:hypothetical protein
MPSVTPLALKPFYRLRFAATGMSMLSAVLLPWLVYTATQRIAAAGLVMLIEASVRLVMSLYGGQLAHALGGRRTFALSQAACAAGFALFAGVLPAYPVSVPLALTLVVAALLFMQSGVTLGNVVTEACTVAFVQAGATDVPGRVRSIDLLATACALPLGGWLVFAFNAPLALIALGCAARARRRDTDRAPRGHLRSRRRNGPRAFLARRPRRVALARAHARRAAADRFPARRERAGDDAVRRAALPARRQAARRTARLAQATDVLFLTHYKAIEAAAAAAIVLVWTRYATRTGAHHHGGDVRAVRLSRGAARSSRTASPRSRSPSRRSRWRHPSRRCSCGYASCAQRSCRGQPAACRRRARRARFAGLRRRCAGGAGHRLRRRRRSARWRSSPRCLFVGMIYGARTRVPAPARVVRPARCPRWPRSSRSTAAISRTSAHSSRRGSPTPCRASAS